GAGMIVGDGMTDEGLVMQEEADRGLIARPAAVPMELGVAFDARLGERAEQLDSLAYGAAPAREILVAPIMKKGEAANEPAASMAQEISRGFVQYRGLGDADDSAFQEPPLLFQYFSFHEIEDTSDMGLDLKEANEEFFVLD